MNNRKLRFTVLSILVLVMVCLGTLSGCKKNKDGGDGNASSTEVYVERSMQPKLLYVVGQDLDLSSGALTVVTGSEKKHIPFTDSSISVSGYDKNTVGNQTLTISYNGKTTTITVAVVERVTAENLVTEYFVGEAFDKSKGRLKINNDDGTTSTVELTSSYVTVKTFNNTTAGATDVTLQYKNGSVTYDYTFSVTLYTPDKIDFKQPNKYEYLSHEKDLNFSGGYLYLEAAKPSTFKKSIQLSSVTVTGYDPDAVTEANKDTPVTQTIKISYAGNEWSYNVNVYYSPIYVIEGLASKIENVDLELKEGQTVADITLPTGAGEAAKEAIQRYFSLNSANRSLVDSDLMISFARVAALYVNKNDYVSAVNGLADAFVLTADGQLSYVGKDYNAVKAAIEALNDPESDYNASAALMRAMNEEFGEETFTGNYKISQLTSPHTEEVAALISARLEHIIAVYDLLADIPSTWKNDMLNNKDAFISNHGADIVNAVFTISSSDFTGSQFAPLYAVIIRWRSDFFEIIYSYYYYAKDGGKDQLTSDLWGKIPAPGILEDFWNAFNSAYNIAYTLTNQSAGATTGYDLFQYHYYYSKAVDLSKEIKSSGNELYTTLYNALNLDAYINVYLNAPSSSLLGFYDFMGPALNNEKILATLNAYNAVLDVIATTGTLETTSANRTKVLNLFNSMVDLTPTELHWFLSSICLNYHNVGGAVLIFDYYKIEKMIAQILYGFFLSELPKNTDGTLHAAQASFINLIQAMETYPTAQFNEEALNEFKSYMNLVNEQFNSLTAAEKSAYRALLGTALDKYNKYYTAILDQTTVTLSAEMKEKFDELYSTLDQFNTLMNDTEKLKLAAAYPTLMGLYSKATALYNEILDAAKLNSSVAHALSAYLYEISDNDPEHPTVLKFTVDSYYYFIKFVAYGSMVPNGHVDYVASLSDTLIALLPLYEAELNATVYSGDINSMIAIIRALDEEKLYAFYSINANVAYFDAINRYAEANAAQDTLDPGSASDNIDSILEIYKQFAELYSIVYSNKYNDNQRTIACTAMIALYNKAKLLYDDILELAATDAGVMNAINFKLFSVTVAEDSEPVTGLLDDYMTYMQLTTKSLLSASDELISSAKVENAMAFLIKLIPLLTAEANSVKYEGNDILDLLAEFRTLAPAEKYAVYVLQGNLALYAELERYFTELLENDAIISNLFNAEIYYSLYELNNEDTESLATFKEAMEKAIEIYATLTEADKGIINDLYYNKLLAIYNELYPAA